MLCFIKNLMTENMIFGFKIIILMRNHENYDSDDEKKFKIFQCNPNDPNCYIVTLFCDQERMFKSLEI